jgi:hypothetical protein
MSVSQGSPGTARRLPPGYVETVRVAWERTLRDALRSFLVPASRGRPHALMPLTESSAPRVHRVAREIASTLAFDRPYGLFQTRQEGEINAQALYHDDPVGIRLIGPVVSVLDDTALGAMIGHELGHCLAHGGEADRPPLHLRPAHLVRRA